MEDKSVSVKILIKQMDLLDVHFNSAREKQSVNESVGEQCSRKLADKRREKLHQKSIEIGASAGHCSIVFPVSIYCLGITLFVALDVADGDNKKTTKAFNNYVFGRKYVTISRYGFDPH